MNDTDFIVNIVEALNLINEQNKIMVEDIKKLNQELEKTNSNIKKLQQDINEISGRTSMFRQFTV